MRGELVAIDLETTGLDPKLDAIIEIGAVRTRDGEIVAEYSTLINPGTAIPPYVTHLTGIRTEDVAGASGIEVILPLIQDFVGNSTIVGHNVTFDIGFFRPHGLFSENRRVDTYDLASVLIPGAPRYNLLSLASQLGIDLKHAHRALDDARAAALLYWELWLKALELPYVTLREISSAAQGMAWDTAAVFDAALAEQKPQPAGEIDFTASDIFGPYGESGEVLQPNLSLQSLDEAEIIRLVGSDGPLARVLPGYEHRPQQADMAAAIARAFSAREHMLIEAGTGTGKSLAYLVPSILWATQNNRRVVVSTNTIMLQDQLIQKDIPVLEQALGTPFRTSVLKGRSNYLCPRRLAAIRRRRPTNIDELRTLAKILVWLMQSGTGDKGELSLRGQGEHQAWQRMSAQDEDCTLERCQAMMQGTCPFFKARKAAEAAHLLVVNHALLVSDAITEHQVLPDYRYLVIDEAHQLEEAVTGSMNIRLDRGALLRRLADLGSLTTGLMADLLRGIENGMPEKDIKRLRAFVKIIADVRPEMEHHITALFETVQRFASETREVRSEEVSAQVLLTLPLRARPGFAQLQAVWSTLDEYFEVLALKMRQLTDFLTARANQSIPTVVDLIHSTSAVGRYLDDARRQLNGFFRAPDANTIYWMSFGPAADGLTLMAAPLHVGSLLERGIWQHKDVVILTSATLRAKDSFDYIRGRLSADDIATLELGSPFDYRQSTLIFIPDDIAEPNSRRAYQQAVERGLIELAAALNGRVLGLFTSYAQLRETAQHITPLLALGNITVYDQSDGTSRQALLEGFKSTEKAVLLGTRSFWEGIDIPGDSLSAVVIIRLPFAVPTDPIFAARSATYVDSFSDFAVPDAILRFRQGFGRLIRTRTDRGVVAIFDSRVLNKGYGAAFLEALPECTLQFGSLSLLPEAARNWLNRPRPL